MNPKVTFASYATSTIDDYHDDFSQIWARDSSERSAFDLWLHVIDHISRVARAIRKQEPPAVIDDIADSVSGCSASSLIAGRTMPSIRAAG